MAHKVRITPEAEADLRSIGDYIVAQHAPEAARRPFRPDELPGQTQREDV